MTQENEHFTFSGLVELALSLIGSAGRVSMREFATTSAPSSSSRRLRYRRVFKWLIISAGLIVAAGAVFQFSMTLWESHLYPPPGKLVDIGGLRLHINCTGAGSPAVIMEAGPNDSSVIWQLVQPEITRFTHVCSYDRAGFGGVTRPMSRAVV